MALTRKMLKAMGIEDEKADEIIEAHAETVSALKQQRDEAQARADEADKLRKELDEAKAGAAEDGGWKAKFDAERKAFDEFRQATEAKAKEAEGSNPFISTTKPQARGYAPGLFCQLADKG